MPRRILQPSTKIVAPVATGSSETMRGTLSYSRSGGVDYFLFTMGPRTYMLRGDMPALLSPAVLALSVTRVLLGA